MESSLLCKSVDNRKSDIFHYLLANFPDCLLCSIMSKSLQPGKLSWISMQFSPPSPKYLQYLDFKNAHTLHIIELLPDPRLSMKKTIWSTLKTTPFPPPHPSKVLHPNSNSSGIRQYPKKVPWGFHNISQGRKVGLQRELREILFLKKEKIF